MAFEFKLPDIGEGVVEGEIVEWLVKEGDFLEEDQPMVEVMTDKATVELPSPRAGKVLECKGEAGDVIEVGEVLIVIEEADEGEAPKAEETPQDKPRQESISASSLPDEPPEAEPRQVEPRPVKKVQPAPVVSADDKPRRKALATPAVRRVARERGIDIQQVDGSGPGGRVTREDLDRFQQEGPPEAAERGTPPAPSAPAQGEIEIVPYRALRKKIGDRLAQSKRVAPHFTYVDEVDMTELVKLRRHYQQMPATGDVKLTYLPFIIKAVIKGLQKHPIANASLDEEKGEIHIKHFFNIGVATATDNGLIVPVVKQADQKGMLELAQEIGRLAEAAREGKIALEDLQGGTFTITSLGKLGGIMATPVINYPEAAILGVHKIEEKPVVREGEIVIRSMMNLSVSMDHRIVDGQTGAEFMNDLIPYLENPALLLL
ncbi:MAG TPA: dihydrolipoamide acetyltransferase family protein [Acidobacteriota bacterium]|nr:dihydrolipoamide acetyltransferase family protein [Acidobacteriota bacterium]